MITTIFVLGSLGVLLLWLTYGKKYLISSEAIDPGKVLVYYIIFLGLTQYMFGWPLAYMITGW